MVEPCAPVEQPGPVLVLLMLSIRPGPVCTYGLARRRWARNVSYFSAAAAVTVIRSLSGTSQPGRVLY